MPPTTYQLHRNGQYFQAAWTDSRGHRKRLSLGRVTKREAVKLLQQLIASHTLVPAGRDLGPSPTLASWLERYLEIRQPELDAATLTIHSRACDLLSQFFVPTIKLEDMTRSGGTDWRAWLAGQLGESTVCKYVRAAKVIFKRAIAEQLSSSSPVEHLVGTAPIADSCDRRLVPLIDVLSAMGAGDEIGTMIGLCYFAGLRRSEAIHLRWRDVDLENGRITIVPRGGKATTKQRRREVRLEGELAELLRHPGQGDDTVLGLLERGRDGLVNRLLRAACTKAEVDAFTFQQLRQSRDTLWHSVYPSHVACSWLGHSEAVARQHYLSIPEEFYETTH